MDAPGGRLRAQRRWGGFESFRVLSKCCRPSTRARIGSACLETRVRAVAIGARLAQLVRARSTSLRCRRFESGIANRLASHANGGSTPPGFRARQIPGLELSRKPGDHPPRPGALADAARCSASHAVARDRLGGQRSSGYRRLTARRPVVERDRDPAPSGPGLGLDRLRAQRAPWGASSPIPPPTRARSWIGIRLACHSPSCVCGSQGRSCSWFLTPQHGKELQPC